MLSAYFLGRTRKKKKGRNDLDLKARNGAALETCTQKEGRSLAAVNRIGEDAGIRQTKRIDLTGRAPKNQAGKF